MSDQQSTEGSTAAHIIAALGEVIDALDRRGPHIERAGEIQIAKDAAMLRSVAVTRINELTCAGSDHDSNLVNAIMTDDGSPAGKK